VQPAQAQHEGAHHAAATYPNPSFARAPGRFASVGSRSHFPAIIASFFRSYGDGVDGALSGI
jgi:hypothetical protein